MSEIKIVRDKISLSELKDLAQVSFLDFIKGVVDVEQGMIAFGGEMHADAEKMLLEQGSKQDNLWGFNIVFNRRPEEIIEYTSLINIRPRQGNRKMEIEGDEMRKKIKEIIWKLVDGIS